MSKHTIEVNGIRLFANHGCLDEEGRIGGEYTVDVSLTTNFTPSTLSDDLTDTIDYVWVNKIVHEEMLIRSKLIEHVGQRMINRILQHPQIQAVKLKLTKHLPPINGDVANVAIIIEEERQ